MSKPSSIFHITLYHIIPYNSTTGCFVSLNDFKENILVLFLRFFIGQHSLNIIQHSLDIERVQADGITFMEAAKWLFPDRNGSQNPNGSMMGWCVWKFHSTLHKAMDLLLYGWSENVSTPSGECAHKVLFHVIPHNSTYAFQLDVKWLNWIHWASFLQGTIDTMLSGLEFYQHDSPFEKKREQQFLQWEMLLNLKTRCRQQKLCLWGKDAAVALRGSKDWRRATKGCRNKKSPKNLSNKFIPHKSTWFHINVFYSTTCTCFLPRHIN